MKTSSLSLASVHITRNERHNFFFRSLQNNKMRKYGMDYCFCKTVILKVVFGPSQCCAIICRLFFNDDVILYLATKLYFFMKLSSCFNDVIIDDVILYLAI